MKIGIFGCTADPFTLAHREIVKTVLEQKLVDKVIIAPTVVNWHRKGKKPWLDDAQKIDVINKLLASSNFIDNVIVYDKDFALRSLCKGNVELERRFIKKHRFIDTLIDIKSDHLDDDIYVIMGNDSWSQFETWSNWREIAGIATGILVANGRNGFPNFNANENVKNATWFSIDPKFADSSATKIRETFMSVENYVAYALDKINKKDETQLLHTPIFDVVKGTPTETGLQPIKVNASDWVTIIVEKTISTSKKSNFNANEFLVEKQFRYGSNCEIEEFPCGMVEKDEDPVNAAARELEEETGYKIKPEFFTYLGSTSPNPAFMTNTMHYFYVNITENDVEIVPQRLDEHEKLKFYWKSRSEFYCDTMTKAIKNGIVPAMLLAAFKIYEDNVGKIV